MGVQTTNTESVCCSLLPHSAWYGVGGWGTRGAWWPAVDCGAFGVRLDVVWDVVSRRTCFWVENEGCVGGGRLLGLRLQV